MSVEGAQLASAVLSAIGDSHDGMILIVRKDDVTVIDKKRVYEPETVLTIHEAIARVRRRGLGGLSRDESETAAERALGARVERAVAEAFERYAQRLPATLRCMCGTPLELRTWSRPGGPSGNGWVCPVCRP